MTGLALLRAQFADVLTVVGGRDFTVIGARGEIERVTYRERPDPATVVVVVSAAVS